MCKYCEIDDTKLMKGKTFNILGRKCQCAVYIRDHSNHLIVEFGNEEDYCKEAIKQMVKAFGQDTEKKKKKFW